jgi:putative serine protease PepD
VAPAAAPAAAPAQPRYGQYAPQSAAPAAAHAPTSQQATPHYATSQQPGPSTPHPTQPTQPYTGQGQWSGGGTPPGGGDVPPAKSAKRNSTIPFVAALAVGALVGGVSGSGVTLWATNQNDGGSTVVGSANPGTVTINNADAATLVSAVAAKASPSVVTLSVSSDAGQGTGSGVVIDNAGHILTNTHVVTLDGAANAPTVQVQTYDGQLLTATVVGTDPVSDLAVIKVDPSAKLPPIQFANSSDLNVGDSAIAIGAPLGLANTVTDGIVSALNRSITVASSAVPDQSQQQDQAPNQGKSPFDFWNFDIPGGPQQQSAPSSTIALSVIQTDASINPGNSGGALLNANGDLIGINVAIASAGGGQGAAGSIGVGFSIPANLAKRVASEIIDSGKASHGLLGAMVQPVTDGTTLGAEIKEVSPGGAAEAAGLKAGDIVTNFNKVPITSPTDLTAQVRVLGGGDSATMTYVRGGQATTTDVTVGELQ